MRDLLRIRKPLFFLIIQEAVAVALKIRVLDLVAELLHMHLYSSLRCKRQGQ